MANARVSVRRSSSVRPPPTDARPKTRLLTALPDADFRRLLPDLKTISIRPKQVLQRAREPIEYVYFPNGGVCSLTTQLPDGTMIEAATIGDDRDEYARTTSAGVLGAEGGDVHQRTMIGLRAPTQWTSADSLRRLACQA